MAKVDARTSAGEISLAPMTFVVMASAGDPPVRPLSTSQSQVIVSPNPSNGDPIEFSTTANVSRSRLAIHTSSGQLVYESPWIDGGSIQWDLETITGSSATSGAYVYVFEVVPAGEGQPFLVRGTVFVIH